MGKKRTKTSRTAGEAMSAPENDIPLFTEEALNALTARIEKGLGAGNGLDGANSTSNKHEQERKDQSSSKSKKTASLSQAESRRGTKRDAHGNTKLAGTPSKDRKSAQREHGGFDKEALLQEILALGGTEEDLDLVADVVSDGEELSDMDIDTSLEPSLQKELAGFVSGLGIEDTAGAQEDDSVDQGTWSSVSESNASPGPGPQRAETHKPEPIAAEERPMSTSDKGNQNRLIFEARSDWHNAVLPALSTASDPHTREFSQTISSLKDYAISLLEADASLYASKHLSSSSSHRFLSTIMASGTLSDKVSALTLVVQESPVHTTKSFESLLTLAKKRSRGQAVTALGALKDLLGAGVVLPADRRLRAFASQPGLLGTLEQKPVLNWRIGDSLPGNISKAHLIYWAFEDWLKESYFDMLKVLEGWCNDEVQYARTRAVGYVYELLKEKPEQEANLLRLLVNKLGDPEKKIASRASYLLLQLQVSHPLMKPIIIRSIESELLLRPGQNAHAKYYAINTLNQTILSAKEEPVAMKLLDLYFEQFVSLLKKPEKSVLPDITVVNRKGQIQGGGAPMGKKAKARASKEEEAKLASEETTEKLISAVLTGVNRAFPFSKTDDHTLEKHMDTLFKITHSSNFNTSIQALMLIEQLATSKHLAVDRFYRTLYESLLDPRLITSSKHALYLNLLFRALKADLNAKRVEAFAKRMLQVITLHQPPFICGIIYLLKELEPVFPALRSLKTEPEEGDEDEEESFRDVPEEGDVLVQSNPRQPQFQSVYDGRKRDPEHSNADKSCLWESLPFLVHFHPSVSLFASRLLADEKLPPKPDLASHTLSSFLDRFVYRNAKAAAGGSKGGSIMQPLAGSDSRGHFLPTKIGDRSQQPLNTEKFWQKKAEEVAADEVFFHKYFNQVSKPRHASGKKRTAAKVADDAENEVSENEDEIWQALVDSRPEVEGPSDDDSDMEMLDLDDSDDSDESVGGVDIENDDDSPPSVEDEAEEIISDNQGEDFAWESDSGSDVDELFSKELETGQTEETKDKSKESSREKKRKLKSLPTFASVEDYAAMLDNDEDEEFE